MDRACLLPALLQAVVATMLSEGLVKAVYVVVASGNQLLSMVPRPLAAAHQIRPQLTVLPLTVLCIILGGPCQGFTNQVVVCTQ